jgi:phosphoribosylformylglycinamidine synthase subunit PurS
MGGTIVNCSLGSIRCVRYEARVEITHLPGIADPQGATIERSLPALGYPNVSQVSVGKSIRLVLEAADEGAAQAQVDEMCQRLLANPVIERYDYEVTEGDSPAVEEEIEETLEEEA